MGTDDGELDQPQSPAADQTRAEVPAEAVSPAVADTPTEPEPQPGPEPQPEPAPEPAPEPRPEPGPEAELDPPTTPIPLAAVAAQLVAPPPVPRGPARWPLAVALLNLTGLALGYAYLARRVRLALSLALTVALVVTAFLTDAAGQPWLWRGVFVGWLVLMALEGWWLARRHPGSAAAPRTRPTLVATGAVVAVGVAYGLYVLAGNQVFASAERAKAGGDCAGAVSSYNRVTGMFELTLSAKVAAAAAGRTECESFQRALARQEGGDFDAAITGYLDFLTAHPGTSLEKAANDRLQATYLSQARKLRAAAEHTEATVVYRELLKRYPDGVFAAQARPELADTYLDEAAAYRAKFASPGGSSSTGPVRFAMESYLTVQRDFADTAAAAKVPAAMAETFNEAMRPFVEQKYCEALPLLDYFVGLPAATGVVDIAHGHRVQAQYQCGVAVYGQRDFEAAIDHFEALTKAYPGHALDAAAQAGLIAARIARAGPATIPPLPPPLTGDSPGSNPVTIYNDSPFELEILIAGATAHRVVVPACSRCKADYPEAEGCSDLEGKPSYTLRLSPGTYQLATRYLDEVLGPLSLETFEVRGGYWLTTCLYS